MSLPASDPPAHLYPQAVQLKLYQAFIFSIPILFSIILFLLFYLFYLKRRSLAAAAAASSTPASSPTLMVLPGMAVAQSSYLDIHSECDKGLFKEKLKEMLPTILFNEDLEAKDTLCCVCLGEFEMAEEQTQIPVCKHIFHLDCIQTWLFSHSTCPLCRCSVYHSVVTTKLGVVSVPSSPWQSLYVGRPDLNDEVLLGLADLQSQEHIIEIGDLSDRVAIADTTDASQG